MPQPYVIIPANGSEPAEEWIRLGVEAQLANKFADAERHYRHALRLSPRHAVATQNLAVVFAQVGQLNEGLLAIERAAIFDGVQPIIHTNRAFMCLEADRLDEALEAARYAVSISPNGNGELKPEEVHGYLGSRLALAMISATAGLPDQAIPLYSEILDKDPKHPVAAPNSCFVLTLTPATPTALLKQRQRWYEANKYTGEKRPHDNDRNPNRIIRIGYVGGDFKRHSAAMIFGGTVLGHDKSKISTYLYSSLPVDPNADDVTKRFMVVAGENWRDISAMNDADADALVRKDRIDILVDLAAHTNGGRLPLFCRKPAPIQVTAWGFAHGTGIPEIDYFLADQLAVPEDERQHYAEKIIDLPCIVSYLPPIEYNLKGKSQAPQGANDFITFGSYARYEKLSDRCLATFAEILRGVPESRLEFKDHAFRRPYSIRRVLAAMPDIAPERILFSISTPHPDHLLSYQQADVCLDPFPHGGGVVAMEQLWMGVPVCTLYGTQPSGRTAASVLTLMGRKDWVARTPEEYVEVAVRMAGDAEVRKARKTLRDEFLNCPAVK